MSVKSHEFQWFYDEPSLRRAVVIAPKAVDATRVPRADIIDLDSRERFFDVPIVMPPGIVRLPRFGQIVKVLFVHGAKMRPYIVGHAHQLDPGPPTQASPWYDPLPKQFAMIDDLLVAHDETGAFMRFRNKRSVPARGGGDGRAARWEMTMASGASISFDEYPQPEPQSGLPPPPNRAKMSISMPSGESFLFDEPAPGQSTIALSHPSGAKVTIDAQGNMTFATPGTISFGAGGLDPKANAVMTEDRVKAMIASLQSVLTQYLAQSVQAGSGAPPVDLTGVAISGSTVVRAKD